MRTTQALVLYESLFGNTAAVAEAVAGGMREAGPDAVVDCRSVDEAVRVRADVDLVVVGAPTHFWGLTRAVSRTMESQYERRITRSEKQAAGARRQAVATTGLRSRFAALPAGGGRAAAAFDTRMTGPLTGGARRAIARRLERAGYLLVAPPETFFVEAIAGPLRPGEADRARAWGSALARALDQHDSPNRRHIMDATREHVLTSLDGQAPRTAPAPDGVGVGAGGAPALDLTRVVTTTELVVGAVLVARYLSRRPGTTTARVTMGPGGWVSMKGGTVAVRRGSRPWARPTTIRSTTPDARAPLWARVLSAVPLQALTR